MIISDIILDDFQLNYPLEPLVDLNSVLFIDIETTGFIARSSRLYLIGCGFYEGGTWKIRQWFAENKSEETDILSSFLDFSQKFTCLIHFNGKQFDLPYLRQKSDQLNIPFILDQLEEIDIYKSIAPLKCFLKLPNCRQKSIEQFLGIGRTDVFTGGELISVYDEYCIHPSEELRYVLLLHNSDDVKGMLECLPILSYADLGNSEIKVLSAEIQTYKDFKGDHCKELLLHLQLEHAVPIPLSTHGCECFCLFDGNLCTLKIPVYEGTLKYFYPNYKDYYYLPEEDVAMHKSVAEFVDKAHRVQAKAATCYTKKNSNYLPQWETLFEPTFKREWKDSCGFFELTSSFLNDTNEISKYASHVLKQIVK